MDKLKFLVTAFALAVYPCMPTAFADGPRPLMADEGGCVYAPMQKPGDEVRYANQCPPADQQRINAAERARIAAGAAAPGPTVAALEQHLVPLTAP